MISLQNNIRFFRKNIQKQFHNLGLTSIVRLTSRVSLIQMLAMHWRSSSIQCNAFKIEYLIQNLKCFLFNLKIETCFK